MLKILTIIPDTVPVSNPWAASSWEISSPKHALGEKDRVECEDW
jgi:hypothetical protein